jgi:hypothetical protein
VYFYGLNYKYLKIHHEIIKHVIWLGKNIEVNMVLDSPLKNTYLLTIGLHILYLISDTIHSLLFYHIGL